MSLYALSWAFEQALPPNEKIVLLALADCENGETLRCDPTQRHIAAKASVSVRQVRVMLTALEDRQLIFRTKRGADDGGRKSDDFRLACRGLAADSAGGVSGRIEGGYRQAVAAIENRKEPEELLDGPVLDVTTDGPVDNSGTGPSITPATFSKTHRQPLHPPSIFASVGYMLPTSFDDVQLLELCTEILDHAGARVIDDPTGYVIRSLRNNIRPSERQRGRWLLRADEIAVEHLELGIRAAGF